MSFPPKYYFFIIFGILYCAVRFFIYLYIVSNGSVTGELESDLEASDSGLIEVQQWFLLRDSQENRTHIRPVFVKT